MGMFMAKGAALLLLGGLLLLSGGCARYSLVEEGETVTLDGCCTAKSPVAWSRAKSGKREYWTVDGPRLEQMVILKGIEAGEVLFAVEPDPGQTPPRFEAGLTDAGMRRLLENALAAMGVGKMRQFRYLGSRLGNMPGFRVSFAFTGSDGLERLGLLVGTERLGRLYLIFYHGDAVRHFHQYLPAVEEVIQSLRFVEGGWFGGSASSAPEEASSASPTPAASDQGAPTAGPAAAMEAEEVILQPRAVIPP